MYTAETNSETTIEKDALIDLLISFVKGLGIEVIEGITENDTFVPGLEIQHGTLVFERKKLSYPGDILHEAGHIAVTEAAERKLIHGDVTNGQKGKEGYEFAAMLWSYAACVKLHIPPSIVFHKNGYKGDSEWLIENYTNKQYIGLPLITWMGMTKAEEFPVMLKWLRD